MSSHRQAQGPAVRLTLDFLGLCLDIHFGPIGGPETTNPEPMGSTCGVLERTPSWDHDQRVPLGFARPTMES